MNYRTLGQGGIQISEVGLGCWQIGADWGKSHTKAQAFEILQQAVDSGITLFDTADVYGDGQSEAYIGEFLQATGAPVKVITKFGRGGDVFPNGYSEQAMRAAVLRSIERLKVDALELVQLHCIPTEELRKGQVFDWLRKLQAEGLIKAFGASVETVEEGLICLEQEGLQSLQVIFNIFRQKLIEELFPNAKANGVGIIVRLPLASGLLTGKFTHETTFSENDHRNYNRNGEIFNVGETFAGLEFGKGIDLVDRIKNNYLPQDHSLISLALRWILDHDAVSCIIPGASSPSQVISNASVSDMPALSKELHQALQAFYSEEVATNIRGAY